MKRKINGYVYGQSVCLCARKTYGEKNEWRYDINGTPRAAAKKIVAATERPNKHYKHIMEPSEKMCILNVETIVK